jgi:hypothetical protein
MNVNCARLVAAIAVGLLLPFSSSLYAQFEGIVETSNLTTDELGKLREYVMTMWIKDGMVKVTHSSIGDSHGTTLIYRNDKRETWVLNDEAKNYLSIPQDSVSRSSEAPGIAARSDPHTLNRTRKTRNILGYPAEQIIVRQGELTTEVWGTKNLPHLARGISNVLGSSETAGGWAQELVRMGLFALVSTTKVHGKVVESQTVTRIEKRDLPQEVFDIPAGYRRESTQDMIRRLGQESKP